MFQTFGESLRSLSGVCSFVSLVLFVLLKKKFVGLTNFLAVTKRALMAELLLRSALRRKKDKTRNLNVVIIVSCLFFFFLQLKTDTPDRCDLGFEKIQGKKKIFLAGASQRRS